MTWRIQPFHLYSMSKSASVRSVFMVTRTLVSWPRMEHSVHFFHWLCVTVNRATQVNAIPIQSQPPGMLSL